MNKIIRNIIGTKNFATRFEKRNKKYRVYKCPHCKQDLGEPTMDFDEYDMLKSHIWSCPSKLARDFRKSKDDESRGGYNENI